MMTVQHKHVCCVLFGATSSGTTALLYEVAGNFESCSWFCLFFCLSSTSAQSDPNENEHDVQVTPSSVTQAHQ